MNNIKNHLNITVQYCFPDNNSSCRKEVRAGPGYIFLSVFLSCVAMCAVFLNLLVIISISHFKQFHTPTNLLILSLAVADLLVGLFIMPVNIMGLTNSCWYLGKVACSVFPVINGISSSASLCSLVFIAIDQYIAICEPLFYSTKITVCKTTLLITLGWFSAIFYVTITLYFNDNFNWSQTSTRCYGECVLVIKYAWVIVDLVVSFVGPCSVILVLYSIIFKVARRQAKAVRAVRIDAPHKRGTQTSSFSEIKAAKKLGMVIFVYLVCWIPFYLSSLSVESMSSASMVWTVFTWLIYMNSSVNPLMYAIFYSWFRASVKYLMTC